MRNHWMGAGVVSVGLILAFSVGLSLGKRDSNACVLGEMADPPTDRTPSECGGGREY